MPVVLHGTHPLAFCSVWWQCSGRARPGPKEENHCRCRGHHGCTIGPLDSNTLLLQAPAVISLENLSTYIGQPFGAQQNVARVALIFFLRYTADSGHIFKTVFLVIEEGPWISQIWLCAPSSHSTAKSLYLQTLRQTRLFRASNTAVILRSFGVHLRAATLTSRHGDGKLLRWIWCSFFSSN